MDPIIVKFQTPVPDLVLSNLLSTMVKTKEAQGQKKNSEATCVIMVQQGNMEHTAITPYSGCAIFIQVCNP